MSEPRGVDRLSELTGVGFEHISAAATRTEAELEARRQRLSELEVDADASVVLMGSWGRRELTSGSDDDFMVLFEGGERSGARPTIEEVGTILDSQPGPEDIFGQPVWLDDLRGKIGLDRDTNTNLTRRMLFVLESIPALGEVPFRQARRSILEGYLQANVKDHRPPRFLLNDLVRYWRTIAVDFEGKLRSRAGEGWGLRNAKLRLSRKALFASGLLPVLACHRYRADQMLAFLETSLEASPLDRIAATFVEHDAADVGIRALGAYDEFLAILDDLDQRAALQAIGVEEADSSPLFARVRELGHEFQAGLLALLFDNPEMRRWVREYLVF